MTDHSETQHQHQSTAQAKQPQQEIYGFVLYLGSFIALVAYALWAYVPHPVLHRLGIAYYPDKYWAIALPALMIMSIVFTYVAFIALNLMKTDALDSLYYISDEQALVSQPPSGLRVGPNRERIPELVDIPLSTINKSLFHIRPGHHRTASSSSRKRRIRQVVVQTNFTTLRGDTSMHLLR